MGDDFRSPVALQPRPYLLNVAFNGLGGVAVGAAGLLVPFLLTRLLSPPDFAIWSVCFPVVAYAAILGTMFNSLMLQGISAAAAKSDVAAAREHVSTLGLCGIVASLLFIVCIWCLAPVAAAWAKVAAAEKLRLEATWRMLGVVGGASILVTMVNAVFSGLQRYEWDNAYKFLLNIAFLAGTGVLFLLGDSQLSSIAWLYVAAVVAAALPSLVAAAREGFSTLFSLDGFNRPYLEVLGGRAGGLAAWQIGILMVTGLDLIFVLRFEPTAVAGYALALACVTACSGFLGAALGPMMPRLTILRIRQGDNAITALFLRAQQTLVVLLAIIVVALLAIPGALWKIVVPPAALADFQRILPILAIAMAIRFSTALYALTVLSAGIQKMIIASPILEGVINVAASYFGGMHFGATGIAAGTLIGAVFCLAAHSIYNSQRTGAAVRIKPWQLVFPWPNHRHEAR